MTVLFLATGFALDDFEYAWEVVAGIASPFDKGGMATLALSIGGYLILPIFVGIAVSTWVGALMANRLLREDEATALIEKLIDSHLRSGSG